MNEYPNKQTYKEMLNSQNVSDNFVIMIILSNTFQEKLCFLKSNSQNNRTVEDISYKIFEGVALNAIFTLSDTACNESIQKHRGSFGQQRLWGGIVWGTVAPLAGFINDYTEGYLASYILMGVMMVLFLINMSTMALVKPHFSKNILKDVGTVLKSKDFLIFEAMVFVNGLGTVMIWFYLIWFLNSIGVASYYVGSQLLSSLSSV
ncbi:hypothetical protein JTE90_015333 [Oedothorax gibbosus]|uniref:Major facilitator superfamily associated domain-containing protein n=1 Tax=Oedothorax gibbosus TaxID=931172 RepID=A0AAV6U5R0_9ARAC|nr:hypothetical protein JTE90_015333 [Oedothorax gibbosus]